MSRAFYCAICDGEPMWRIERHGDAVISWACAEHLSEEAGRLQRDWEITQLSIRLCSKLREWAEVGTMLEETANG
jgi:hypothetical protein